MKSTNYNVTDPLHIDSISMTPYMSQDKLPHVETCTQDQYNIMNQHDPLTVYCITDVPGRIYLGDSPVSCNEAMGGYFLGTKMIEGSMYYVIYAILNSRMIEINRYQLPTDAIKALELYNYSGTHENADTLTSIIRSFINNEISFLDMLIGILSSIGFRNDPHLQDIIKLQEHYASYSSDFYVPERVIGEIHIDPYLGGQVISEAYKKLYPILLKLAKYSGSGNIGVHTIKTTVVEISNVQKDIISYITPQ